MYGSKRYMGRNALSLKMVPAFTGRMHEPVRESKIGIYEIPCAVTGGARSGRPTARPKGMRKDKSAGTW
jgi:hypothetical protein